MAAEQPNVAINKRMGEFDRRSNRLLSALLGSVYCTFGESLLLFVGLPDTIN